VAYEYCSDSDVHSELGIGCSAMQFDDPMRTEADVIAALKHKRYRAVVYCGLPTARERLFTSKAAKGG